MVTKLPFAVTTSTNHVPCTINAFPLSNTNNVHIGSHLLFFGHKKMLFDIATNVPLVPLLLAGLSFALVLWRVWRFTIRPLLHPDEPKDIPYWTPVLGHVVSFFRDSFGVISHGR